MAKLAVGLTALTAAGCAEKAPEDLQARVIAPLGEEARYWCEASNGDPTIFNQKHYNSWVTRRKNHVMDILGYDTSCVGWKCAGGSTAINFGIVTENGDCAQKDGLSFQQALNQLNPNQLSSYSDALAGTGTWDYSLFIPKKQ